LDLNRVKYCYFVNLMSRHNNKWNSNYII